MLNEIESPEVKGLRLNGNETEKEMLTRMTCIHGDKAGYACADVSASGDVTISTRGAITKQQARDFARELLIIAGEL